MTKEELQELGKTPQGRTLIRAHKIAKDNVFKWTDRLAFIESLMKERDNG